MGAMRDVLNRLQTIETQIRSVRSRIESKRKAVRGHQRRVETLERQIEDTHEAAKKTQTEVDRLELDRKVHEEHLEKLRETLNHAKTNKEYAAVLTQLNTDKAGSLKLEDKILAIFAQVDELKKKEAELKEQLAKEIQVVQEIEQTVDDFEAKLANRLANLTSQRTEISEGIPREVLAIFERACEKHDGEATAMINKVHPKREEYTCGGCNMSVRLETINSLQTSRDTVVQCEICSRILMLEAPEEVTA